MLIIKSDYIRDKLSYIESKVKNDTKRKLYDINTTAEDIFMHILNDVYGWELVNANDIKSNFPAIDLIDTTNEIVIQVTSETTPHKVRKETIEKFQELLKTDEYREYADYKIKMFYIKNKPNFSDKILEEFEEKGVFKSDFLGIEDINTKVSANPTIATKVFKRLCEIFHDKVCDSDVSPNLTTKLGKSTIIGRKKELKLIDEQLNRSKALLVHGIGGMGKSTIVSYYLHEHKNEFDYYGFFEGLEDFINSLELALNLNIEQGEDRLAIVLHELIKLDGNKLLVIDNIQEIKTNKKTIERVLDLKEHDGFKILLTSREEIEDIDCYVLDTLSMDDAKELFNSIYNVENKLLLEDVLEYLDYHTFFVELTAKTLKSKQSLTLESIKNKFESGELSQISIKKEQNFNLYLKKLFTFKTLNYEEKYTMKMFSILPSTEIEIEYLNIFRRKLVPSFIDVFFNSLSYIKRNFFKNISKGEEFEEILNYLVERGWLTKTTKGYKAHQIIKEYILANYPPNLTESYNIITSVQMQINHNFRLLENLEKMDIYIEAIILFLIKTRGISKDTAYYYNTLGESSYKKGLYRKAEFYYTKAIEVFKILRKKYPDIAISYNGLANIYLFNKEYEKAQKYYLIALEIQEKILSKVHPNTAKTYFNLAEFYAIQNKYKKAEALYLEAITIQEKTLKKAHFDTITSYVGLAKNYNLLNNYNQAEKLYVKAIRVREEVFGIEDIYTGMSYMDIALFYFDNKKFGNAKWSIERVIKIWKPILSINHKYMISAKKVLNTIDRIINNENL